MKISILDYGACNISSVYNAFKNLGEEAKVINSLNDIKNSEKIVIPGVGAAKSSLDYLKSNNLFEPLKTFISSGKPTLGICLGLQMFSKTLYENGKSEGLGYLNADVINFPDNKNIFHIGWNSVEIKEKYQKMFRLKKECSFYFCHSYFVDLQDNTECLVGSTKFNIEFPSIIINDNLMGVQFHPEKSQSNGVKILETFIDWNP